jgi:hypothetical protein
LQSDHQEGNGHVGEAAAGHDFAQARRRRPAWDDAKTSEAVDCRTRTVKNVRQAFVCEGFAGTLVRKKPATSPTPKLLDGAAEAKLIAKRLGEPPAGFGHWTLRLLADQMVELERRIDRPGDGPSDAKKLGRQP